MPNAICLVTNVQQSSKFWYLQRRGKETDFEMGVNSNYLWLVVVHTPQLLRLCPESNKEPSISKHGHHCSFNFSNEWKRAVPRSIISNLFTYSPISTSIFNTNEPHEKHRGKRNWPADNNQVLIWLKSHRWWQFLASEHGMGWVP